MLFVGRPYLLYYLSQLRRYANGQNGGWEGRHTLLFFSLYEPYLRSVSIRKKRIETRLNRNLNKQKKYGYIMSISCYAYFAKKVRGPSPPPPVPVTWELTHM